MAAPTQRLGSLLPSRAKYKVTGRNGATVRSEEPLDSPVQRILPHGTIVEVTDVEGRRCRIVNPTKGWGSISTENGYVIMEPLSARPEKVTEETREVQAVDNVERSVQDGSSSSPIGGSGGDAGSGLTPAEAEAEDECLRQAIVESLGAAAAAAAAGAAAGASGASGAVVECKVAGRCGATVRSGEPLDSPVQCTLTPGTIVKIAEVKGRRCRIVNPVKGWGSIATEEGYVIIEPLPTHPAGLVGECDDGQVPENVERDKDGSSSSLTADSDGDVGRGLTPAEAEDEHLRRAIALSLADAPATGSAAGTGAGAGAGGAGAAESTQYKVIGRNGATVRSGEPLDSPARCTLPHGTTVEVTEVEGRRCCIVNPVEGWASISTESGRVLLEPLPTHPTGLVEETDEPQVLDDVERDQVCMERAVNCTLVPCGHQCCCVQCAAEFDQCPICRADVDLKVRVFLA